MGSIRDMLNLNIDLGSVFLCDDPNLGGKSGQELALEIAHLRPELPIFFRYREGEQLPENVEKICSGTYARGEFEKLEGFVNRYIFNRHYPRSFIDSIASITTEVLDQSFEGMTVECGIPYLIRDRLVFGHLFSLIRLESSWCRGYMMVQAEEGCVMPLIADGRTSLDMTNLDFRSVNAIMSDLTNMIWGRFKACFVDNQKEAKARYLAEVPIVVNHSRGYVTFGFDDPKLCFHYRLHDPSGVIEPVSIFQRFVFHLQWSPEDFIVHPDPMENLVKSGDLVFL